MRRLLTILLAFLSTLGWAGTCGNGYTASIDVKINHYLIPSDQTDFPVPVCFNGVQCGTAGVTISFPEMKTSGNGGQVQNTFGSPAMPADMVACDAASGGNALAYQIMPGTYVSATGAAHAYVKQPTASASSDGDIYFFVGNSGVTTSQQGSVFTNSFLAVYTLGNGSTLDWTDLLGSFNATNSSSTATAGALGGGVNFNGSQFASSSLVTSATTNVTISGMFSVTESPQESVAVVNGSGNGYGLRIGDVTGDCGNTGGTISGGWMSMFLPGVTCNVGGTNATVRIPSFIYGHVAMTRGASTWKLYGRGVQMGVTGTTAPNTPSSTTYFGKTSSGANYVGKGDEIRVSSVERSADWNATEADSLTHPALFAYIPDSRPRILQYKYCQNTGANITCAFPKNVTSGNTMLLVANLKSSSCATDLPASKLSDTITSTFTQATCVSSGSTGDDAATAIYTAAIASSGADTVTFTFAGGNYASLWIAEAQNIPSTSLVGTSNTSSTGGCGSGCNDTTGAVTATGSNQVQICAWASNVGTSAIFSNGFANAESFLGPDKPSGAFVRPSGAVGFAVVNSGAQTCNGYYTVPNGNTRLLVQAILGSVSNIRHIQPQSY
jgi:hypothetical protein